MLVERVARELKLQKGQTRDLLLSLSGGLDSTVLAFVVSELRKNFSLKLRALHLNFGLRGAASHKDEQFVRGLCRQWKIPLKVVKPKIQPESGIQVQAREARLKAIRAFPQTWEVLEAHHRDDQIETFFLRLFRGAGLQGLGSLRLCSERDGRRVWRPLLVFSKEDLKKFARASKLKYREDSSNRKTLYDRNFIRLKLLPLIESRFPHARKAMARAIENIQSVERDLDEQTEMHLENAELILDRQPLTLSQEALVDLPRAERQHLLHFLLARRLKLPVTQRQLLEISERLSCPAPWAVNLPRSIVARAKAQKRLVFQGLNWVLGSDK